MEKKTETKVPVEPAVGESKVSDLPAEIPGDAAEAVKEAAVNIAVPEISAAAAAEANKITAEQASEIKQNSELSADDDAKVEVRAYLDIEPEAYSEDSYKLNITPVYEIVVTSGEKEDVVEQARPLDIKGTTTVSIPLPAEFVTSADDVYVQHKGYEYIAEVTETDDTVKAYTATFTNPHKRVPPSGAAPDKSRIEDMKKRNLLIAAGVVAAGVCIWLIARPSKGPKVLLETAPISHITIRNSVTATGTVEPVTQVEVGTQVSGIIDKLYADYNDQVKAGQLIAEMDKVTLQAELESAQAQLASSKTEYEYQTKNYARTKTLHEKQLVSDAEYDQAFYLYETARNAYEQSQAAMVKVKRNLGYATITSPIDGVVISRAVEEGQTVAAGFETPTLFTIANDLTQMQVVADVDEADIGQVADGQRVQFSVDAYPDDTFEGTVLQVRLEATTESNVVTYEVVIDAPNPDLNSNRDLRPT